MAKFIQPIIIIHLSGTINYTNRKQDEQNASLSQAIACTDQHQQSKNEIIFKQ